MPLRRISSLLTFFHKFILPVLFGIGCVNVFILWKPLSFPQPNNFPPVWFFFVAPFLFFAVTLWMSWGMKWVAIDMQNRQLLVSNYRKEIAIPVSEIANVTEFMLSDPRRITIHLHTETEFGKKIVFLGTYRFWGIWAGPHPIVAELLNLAHQ